MGNDSISRVPHWILLPSMVSASPRMALLEPATVMSASLNNPILRYTPIRLDNIVFYIPMVSTLDGATQALPFEGSRQCASSCPDWCAIALDDLVEPGQMSW
jgi:hypothetical protein